MKSTCPQGSIDMKLSPCVSRVMLIFGLVLLGQFSIDSFAQDLTKVRWSGTKYLSSIEHNAIAPTLLVDEHGLHILFQSLRVSSDCEVRYLRSQDKGKTWTEPYPLSKSFSMGVGTCLVSHNGILHAAWCPTERGLNGLYYRQSLDGGQNWSNRKAVTETMQAIFFPKLVPDGQTMYLAWVEQQKIGKDLTQTAPDVNELDVQHLGKNTRTGIKGLETEGYDCTIRLTKSQDGGKTWDKNVPVKRIFQHITNYTFQVKGNRREFAYRTPEGCTLLVSADSGLTWRETAITSEQFGNPQPPTILQDQGDVFQVGTDKLNNHDVLFIRRTDSVPPVPRMISSQSIVDATRAVLEWTGSDDWSADDKLTYSYRLDDATWTPFQLVRESRNRGLNDGKHVFEVRARDEAGNESTQSASLEFHVMCPPRTFLVSTFPRVGSEKRPVVKWRGLDNTTTPENLKFQYKLDSQDWSEPLGVQEAVLPEVSDGFHLLQVRAVDEIGAVDPFPTSTSFTVDSLAPKTTNIKVRDYVKGSNYLFVELSASDNVSVTPEIKYSLKVDGGEWGAFLQFPQIPVQGISDGPHVLFVRAEDEAANIEDPPRKLDFSVQIPPRVEVLEAPLKPLTPTSFQLFLSLWDNYTPPEKIRLRYRINDGPWSKTLQGTILQVAIPKLPNARYQLQIEGTDESNLKDLAPTVYEFVVDSAEVYPPAFLDGKRDGPKIGLSWPDPSKDTQRPLKWKVYRSEIARFGEDPTREVNVIAKDLQDRFYEDIIPPKIAGKVLYYAVSLVDGNGRESNLSPVFITSASALISQSVAAPTAPRPSMPRRMPFNLPSGWAMLQLWPLIVGVFAVIGIIACIRNIARPKIDVREGEKDVLGLIDEGLHEGKTESVEESASEEEKDDEDFSSIL